MDITGNGHGNGHCDENGNGNRKRKSRERMATWNVTGLGDHIPEIVEINRPRAIVIDWVLYKYFYYYYYYYYHEEEESCRARNFGQQNERIWIKTD